MTECTACGASLSIDETTEVNEIITCQDCGSEFEVTGINPFVVKPAPQEEEDWGE